MLIKITVPDKLISQIDKARKTESRASFMRRGAEALLMLDFSASPRITPADVIGILPGPVDSQPVPVVEVTS